MTHTFAECAQDCKRGHCTLDGQNQSAEVERWQAIDFKLIGHLTIYSACLHVLRISRELFIQSTSHLAGCIA